MRTPTLIPRVAAKERPCDAHWSPLCTGIRVGDHTLELKAFPGSNGVATDVRRPLRMYLCTYCAFARGWAWALKQPIPESFDRKALFDEFRSVA